MRTILCFGDSNTWGHDPATGTRLPRDVRWPGVLRRELGEGYEIIEEGRGGRTTRWEKPGDGEGMSGRAYLVPCLESHSPLDMVIILLGTNDLQAKYDVSARQIARAAGDLVRVTKRYTPNVLLIAPPPPVAVPGLFDGPFAGAPEKAAQLAGEYRAVARARGCAFLDASTIIRSSQVDGIHWDAGEHEKLGIAVAELVRSGLIEKPARRRWGLR